MSKQLLEPPGADIETLMETPVETPIETKVETSVETPIETRVEAPAPPAAVYPRLALPRSERKPISVRWRAKPSDIPALSVLVGFVGVALVILALVIALVGANGPVVRTVSSMPGMQSTVAAPPGVVPAHQTYDAVPPTAPTGSVVNIKLVAKEALVAIAPGVAYHAWTFNGSVPGPILRVRQGQTVNFTLQNDTGMPHSIDFHAAQTAWSVNYQPVPAGKSFTFSWVASYPGIFMYHCGTPPAMVHMSNGMYGAIIVDPANGWAPAKEYVLVQSEFYTSQQKDGTYQLDFNKMMSAQPDYVVFNGYANQYKTAPLTAQPGQRIRLFVLNAGPSSFSAFHVIGAIFSDVYIDGNPANHTVGDQTVTIPPGGGDVVELTIPNAGSYPFLTHSFADADMGALGVFSVKP